MADSILLIGLAAGNGRRRPNAGGSEPTRAYMSRSDFVSVTIITYDSGRFIKKCLESVLDQNYLLKEIIVIDNNSSDGTVDILEPFEDRCRIVYNGLHQLQKLTALGTRAYSVAEPSLVASHVSRKSARVVMKMQKRLGFPVKSPRFFSRIPSSRRR